MTNLKAIFLPWLVIREVRAELQTADETVMAIYYENSELRRQITRLKAQIAKFDHDNDGNIGGSKPHGPTFGGYILESRSLEEVCVNPANYPPKR